MGDGSHGPWIGELARLEVGKRGDLGNRRVYGDIRFDIHVSKYISRKISLKPRGAAS